MKKLLILVLVLGVAQLASATIFLSVDGTTQAGSGVTVGVGDSITVYVVDTAGVDHKNYWDMAMSQPATMATPIASAAAGELSAVTDYSTGTLYDFELLAAKGLGTPDIGSQFSAIFTATGIAGETFTMDLLEGASPYGNEDSLTITIVPEPATMAILGLGALLLRRKK